MLGFVYRRDIEWKREWFPNLPVFPKTYWNSMDNCRMFLDKLAKNYNISSLNDWRKISGNLISRRGGKVENNVL